RPWGPIKSGACFEQRGDVFNLWDWIVPSAYAAGCQLKTLSGKVITIHDRDTCIEALGKALYAQAIGVWSNRDSLRQGLWEGLKDQGNEFVDLASDPYGLAKSIGNVALEIVSDPVAAGFKYGYDAADSIYEKSLLYTQALANENYEAAGRHLASLTIDLAMKAAGGVGAGYTAVKSADKIAALKNIERIEKAAPIKISAAIQPVVGDPKLQNLMDNIYKGTRNPNRVGDGTLADAVRHERVTGGTVGGRTHTIKAEETIVGLQNWLDRNPHALQVDRQEAITQIQNLKNALGK
ncbi:hypothetical protein JS562_30380, partial [Agrobacterium sp. S2]|nr:hypothetical protein [Agrobacterium sp. S2]